MTKEPKPKLRKSLKGFGMTFSMLNGAARYWYVGDDGVKRWADNDKPVTDKEAACTTKRKLSTVACTGEARRTVSGTLLAKPVTDKEAMTMSEKFMTEAKATP